MFITLDTSLTAVTQPCGSNPCLVLSLPWQQATLTDLTAAEELLDSLEQAGYTEKQLDIVSDTFVIRWR